MNERFEALSRKAAAGDLTREEHAWLEAWLLEHPEDALSRDWDAAFARRLREKVDRMPATPGLDRALRSIRAERDTPGVIDRLSAWIADGLGIRMNLQAVAAALVVAQAGVIGFLALGTADRGTVETRGPADSAPRGTLLRVAFRSDAKESELRAALAAAGGEIVGGPGQLGVYVVRPARGDPAAAADALKASGVVESVEVFEARP